MPPSYPTPGRPARPAPPAPPAPRVETATSRSAPNRSAPSARPTARMPAPKGGRFPAKTIEARRARDGREAGRRPWCASPAPGARRRGHRPALIPFPTLSTVLRSGPPDAGAAALWITRRRAASRVLINCRRFGGRGVGRLSCPRRPPIRPPPVPQTSGRSHGPRRTSPRGSPRDHRAATRRPFRGPREHRPNAARRPRGRPPGHRRGREDPVSGRLATGTRRPRRPPIVAAPRQ